MHREQIPETCGWCHVGICKDCTDDTSIHGMKVAEGDPDAPVCTDCHTSHEIIHPDEVAFKLASGERCGACHEDRIKHYQETFHGKVLAPGRGSVAACFDCHGHHDIVGIDDEHSRLFGEKKLTCQQCHPSATAKFTGYLAHADHLNREHYPVLYWTFVIMTAIVVGTFLFFGAHTIMWFARSVLLLFRDRKRFMEIKRQAREDRESFIRFWLFEWFLHVLVMTSFLLLVATGMPLKFYYTGWAKAVVNAIGGLDAAAQWHRLGAVVTFAYFALHIGSLLFAGVSSRERFRSPRTGAIVVIQFLQGLRARPAVPHIQDFRDWWAHLEVVLRQGAAAAVRQVDLLGEVRLPRGVLGRHGDRPERLGHVVPRVLHPVPARLDHQCCADHPQRRGVARGRVHLRVPLLQCALPPREIPAGLRHLLRTHLQGRDAPRTQAVVRPAGRDRAAPTATASRTSGRSGAGVIHPLGYLAFGIGLALLVLIVYAMGSRLIAGGH